jgi:hypothetical protein
MQSCKIKKGGNSNLIDWSSLPFLFCAIALQSIKLEFPPFFILRDCIAIYEIGVTSLFYFSRLYCNLLNWSYLPFLFCVIALQSIKLELPPFFILRDCIAIYETGVTSLFYFSRLHCNLLNWSCLPFLFCVIALQSIKLELPQSH